MSIETVIGTVLALQLLVTFSDAEITLRPVGAPWQLESAGFTSETLTEMLQDDIQTIVLNSRGAHETAPEGIIERNLAEAIAEGLRQVPSTPHRIATAIKPVVDSSRVNGT